MLSISDILLVVFFLGLFLFSRGGKRYEVLELLLLAGSITSLLKLFFRVGRVFGWDPFSFPSLHTSLAFSMFFAFPHPFTLLYSAIIGLLRVFEGYHTFQDILGGFFSALLSYVIYRYVIVSQGKEGARKVVHFAVAVLSGYFGLFGNQVAIGMLLVMGAAVVYFLREWGPLKDLYSRYSRSPNDKGPITLTFSLLISSLFGLLPPAGIYIGLVDTLSFFFGASVGHRIGTRLWNGKTIAGFFGGLVGSSVAWLLLSGFYGSVFLMMSALLLPVIEVLSPFDDNLSMGLGLTALGVVFLGIPSL